MTVPKAGSKPSRPLFLADVPLRGPWSYMVITLTAAERWAVVQLADGQRRHPAETASLLITEILVQKGLLEADQ